MSQTVDAQNIFEVSTLPTTAVTIYGDRAEVKRSLKTEVQCGESEIVITQLSSAIEKDSIRVEGRGYATITDVQWRVRNDDQSSEGKSTQLEILSNLRAERKKITQALERLNKHRRMLDGIAEKVGQFTSTSGHNAPSSANSASRFEITQAFLDGVELFIEYYNGRMLDWDKEITELETNGRALDIEIRSLLERVDDRELMRTVREVSILLDVQQAGEVELDVSYLVRQASWEPSYDIRVGADRKMRLTYYGAVEQKTGEAWEETKISLSTATPSTGGQIPTLDILRVGLYQPPPSKPAVVSVSMSTSMPYRDFSEYAPCGSVERTRPVSAPAIYAPSKMEHVPVKVLQSVINTTLNVTRSTTIPPDGAVHKVKIAEVDLKPDLEYECVPSKKAMAFLIARAKNTSPYPLLPGPASIYWDNSFVAKSQLEAVSPQEEFICSLGVDPAVRVDYKPAKKFNEEVGYVSKSLVQNHEQRITIKNTRSDPITIKVSDHYPVSTDEKVKVILDSLGEKRQVTAETGRVEWKLNVNGGQEKELVLKYKVEYPTDTRLEYTKVDA